MRPSDMQQPRPAATPDEAKNQQTQSDFTIFAREIALLADCRAPVQELLHADFQQLEKAFATVKPGKKDGHSWMPAHIQPGQRTAARVESITYLVLDVEAESDPLRDADGIVLLDEHGDRLKTIVGPLPPDPGELAAEITRRGWRCCWHTSYSHTGPDNPRYRLIFDLTRPLQPQELKPLGKHVVSLLGLSECYDKGALEPARLFYFPRCPEERLPLYRTGTTAGDPLPVDILLTEAKRVDSPRHDTAPPLHGDSVIDRFNARHAIGDILERNGYRPKGPGRWLWPGSTTGQPGARVLPESCPERVMSSHGGDPLNDGHGHDAFDVLRILEHGGDGTAVLKAAARSRWWVQALGPTLGLIRNP